MRKQPNRIKPPATEPLEGELHKMLHIETATFLFARARGGTITRGGEAGRRDLGYIVAREKITLQCWGETSNGAK